MSPQRSEREPELVLYRCPTPTDFLCPCGAVARRLRKLDLPHRVERVPYRRGSSHRPEIEELTAQHRVPVLIDAGEIVHDSKRILQYLQWRYEAKQGAPEHPREQPSEAGAGASDGST